jgi:hypothetical protein
MEDTKNLELGEVKGDELSDSLSDLEESDEQVIENYLEYLREVRDSQYPLWMRDLYI